MGMYKTDSFVNWFRSAAPYIHAFRDRTFVIAFGGEVVADGKFIALTHDLNLLQSLGVRLVLVHGVRPQTEARLQQKGLKPRYVKGIRVTDPDALGCVIEASATLGFEIEAQMSMGIANSPMAGSSIRIASGNFVMARPIGVVDGVDFQHTGVVRRVDAVGIRRRLDDQEIVLLPPLGYSLTGELYNLTVEEVATATAISLSADKLIFMTDTPGVVNTQGETLSEMSAVEAESLLKQAALLTEDVAFFLPCAVRACQQGVSKTHLISRHVDGALIQELFTREGIGTMVTRDMHDVLRPATADDIPGLVRLIEPLEADGVLVKRNRSLLESEIHRFFVMLYEGQIIGCVALYPFTEEGSAELAALAINPGFRNIGRGDKLLKYIESQAKSMGIKRLFLLSTRTGQWFVERGFLETTLDLLPKKKQELYNYQRRSKVFVKQLV
ncbi:MAG TPA: amino-acid N-acetyltransferase [Ferrovaceae bacterium]|uniref:amino-acid N-acetyltransferase n=1 Tax=Ferrovum sp. JA12 TaxID=1356299 RepID=UPI0007038A71|nr:amino-acid N-acetyltransferase [Ferrovum sp. JA12]HQT82248.1 amino-acid N-acetyltransferase [Ferrovaceae bacterium]